MDAGLSLREHPVNGRVGGWNVGILSYFEGGRVVNVDGLTNDDVVPYILRDRLHCYLLEHDIRHLLDWHDMVFCEGPRCPPYPALGGYTSGVLARSLTVERVIPGTEQRKNPLQLYSVDFDILKGAGDCAASSSTAR
jgi:hypothetical protein